MILQTTPTRVSVVNDQNGLSQEPECHMPAFYRLFEVIRSGQFT